MSDHTELVKALQSASTVSSAWGMMMLDAAAAIEELQAAQPHWVSVEQPPKNHGKYLVCYVEKGEFYWEEAHYCFYQDGDKWTAWSSYQDDDVEITPDYWMPIEPPKEGV